AKQLALTHHDPQRDDAAIDDIVRSLRSEIGRDAGPHIFAAAEGQVVKLSAEHCVTTPKAGFPAQAPLAPALVGRSALLAMAAPSRIAELAGLLRADEVNVITACVADAPVMTEREKPTLVLLEDSGDDRAVEVCRAIRRLPGEEN